MKLKLGILLLLVLAALAAWMWFASCGGAMHRELKESVVREGAATRAHVDRRCDALERRLDRIEDKLDRLLKLAEPPPLPDGMAPARRLGDGR